MFFFYEDCQQKKSAYLIYERGTVRIRVVIKSKKLDKTLFKWPKQFFTGNQGTIMPRYPKDSEYVDNMKIVMKEFKIIERLLPKAKDIEEMRVLYKRDTPFLSKYQQQIYPKLHNNYISALKRFTFLNDDKPINEYMLQDILAFEKAIELEGLSPNTAKLYHAHLRTLFNRAVEDLYIARSPYLGFRSRLASSKRIRKLVTTEQEQLKKLWQQWEKEDGKTKKAITAMLLQFYTGARIMEAVRITKEDFARGYYIANKGGSRCKIILTDATKLLMPHLPVSLSYDEVYYRVKVLSERLGFKIQTHGMRRAFARAINEKEGIYAAKTALGHSSTSMTERYLFADEEKLQKALESWGKMK